MGVAFVEPAIVPDVYVSGLAEIEDLGDGLCRCTYYVKQKSFQSETTEYVIVARIIMPIVSILESRKVADKTLNLHGREAGGMRLAH